MFARSFCSSSREYNTVRAGRDKLFLLARRVTKESLARGVVLQFE